MKRIFLFLFVAIFAFAAEAQDFKFAYFSYGEALKSMPDYELAATNVNKLRNQYDNELKKAEDEFNAKYEDFLENQRTLAPAILDKRQAELQELLQKNLKFKEEAKRLLSQAENDAFAPLKRKLNATVRNRYGAWLCFVLNTTATPARMLTVPRAMTSA